ncbi:hypothetical protein DsansV1_C26g0196181 [Dioscorea sansibarensis]
MQVVQSQQNSENQSVDAFSMVIGGTRPDRVMLYGKSVTLTDLKGMKEQMREEVRKEMEEQLPTTIYFYDVTTPSLCSRNER